jgi:arylsulfatase A-like enzyme
MLAAATTAPLVGCSKSDSQDAASRAMRPQSRPNVLWVVWDTVRADRMSLYGYDRPTTPKLARWAANARVFDNCVTPGPYTVPSHASMFTGLLPSEHGAHARYPWLDARFDTIAECFNAAGYRTYLFSANPHIGRAENFQQGFEVEEHPWDPKWRAEALRIVREKIRPEDKSSELPDKLRTAPRLTVWDVKACGELAQQGLLDWLATGEQDRPFFAFLNYMEAHRPFIPPERYRRRIMTDEQVARSYRVDRSWIPMWSYTFGLRDYSDDELEVMALTYDACIAELDDLFADLLAALDAGGHLDDTVVVLTSDHGEHLGEQHMLDHQYSLYESLTRVPLVVWYPPAFEPGRESRPVMTFDLFPTLLALAGIDPPAGLKSRAVSLLEPRADRRRLAENPAAPLGPLREVKQAYPSFDPRPWDRTLRALYDDQQKLIWASDDRHELYDLARDPGEEHNLYAADDATSQAMIERLGDAVAELAIAGEPSIPPPEPPVDHVQLLEKLGYIEGKQGHARSASGTQPTTSASE